MKNIKNFEYEMLEKHYYEDIQQLIDDNVIKSKRFILSFELSKKQNKKCNICLENCVDYAGLGKQEKQNDLHWDLYTNDNIAFILNKKNNELICIPCGIKNNIIK